MVSFNNLLIKIFKSHGFEINSSSDYSKYILASKANINLSIGYTDVNEDVDVSKVRNFYRSAKRDNADRLIYVIPGTKYPHNIHKFVDDRNIQLWDRERLERELGRAVLANFDAMGEVGEFDSDLSDLPKVDSSIAAETDIFSDSDLDRASSREPGEGIGTTTTTTEEVPIMVPIIPFGDDGELLVGSDASPGTDALLEPTHNEPAHTMMSHDASEIPELKDYWIIKPIVSKDEAANMASKIVRGFRFNLELIPYFIFSYSCTFESESGDEPVNSGLIGINGLTSNIEEWSGNLNTLKELDEEHTKIDIKFPYERALSLAKEAVVELNTRSVETREESNSTINFEKKKLRPKPDAIEIISKGLFYLPVWCIEGSNGLMIIDATSGKIIKEDFF